MPKDELRTGIDWLSAAMVLVTAVALGWTIWLRVGGQGEVEPPRVGAVIPPLKLLDATTAKPIVLFGLRGRVVWITFWACRAELGAELGELERVWSRLGGRPGFSMVAAAVDDDSGGRVRGLVEKAKTTVPVYLASAATSRVFGATERHLPLHLLIDESGHVGAVAQGRSRETYSRLIEQAEHWLDEMEPLGKIRFAGPRRPRVPADVVGYERLTASSWARRAAAARRGWGAWTTAELTAIRVAPASRT